MWDWSSQAVFQVKLLAVCAIVTIFFLLHEPLSINIYINSHTSITVKNVLHLVFTQVWMWVLILFLKYKLELEIIEWWQVNCSGDSSSYCISCIIERDGEINRVAISGLITSCVQCACVQCVCRILNAMAGSAAEFNSLVIINCLYTFPYLMYRSVNDLLNYVAAWFPDC